MLWSLIAAAFGGALCVAYGLTLPVYTDSDAARQLWANSCGVDGVAVGWHEQMAALRTWRYPLIQGGLSLTLFSGSVMAIFSMFGDPEGRWLLTPGSKLAFFALGIGVIALSWFSQMISLVTDLERREFPTCADSIAIPMVYITTAYGFITIASLIIGGCLTLGFRALPVPLLAWNSHNLGVSFLISAPFAIIALILAFFGVAGAMDSSFPGTPAAVVALFLVEATRSALLCNASDAGAA